MSTKDIDGYFLSSSHCSKSAMEDFNKFLALVKHGAKFIDIRVRKDGVEHIFQADILKYIKPILSAEIQTENQAVYPLDKAFVNSFLPNSSK